MMFSLQQVTTRLNHLNVRKEVSGDEKRLAIDLAFELKVTAEYLDRIEPGLRGAIYKDDGAELRFAKIDTVVLAAALIGAKVTVHLSDLFRGDEVVLDATEVNKFKVTPHQGGTITLTFRVQAHPLEGQIDLLSEVIGEEVAITIVPPGGA